MLRASQSLSFVFNRIKSPRSFEPLRFYAATSSSFAASTPEIPKATIRLREYQDECIQAVLSHIEKGHQKLGISLATGSGKTVIFTHLIGRIRPPHQHATRTLILVHRRELVEQAAKHCTDAYPTKSIDIEMGNLHASGTADITIASVRSITSGDRLMKYDPGMFKLVLVDEAHHIVAPSYMETLQHFGIVKSVNLPHSPVLVGVSATLSRLDGLRLSDAIDHIVYHKDYIDMIGEKWLADVLFTTVKSEANVSRVKTGANGDFQVGSLSKAVNTKNSNEITFRAWFTRASERKSTLVFCVDIEHVVDLTATFRKHGIDAQYVTADTPKQTRSKRLNAFRNQEFPVLLNCGIFTEGTDIPNIDCVLLARPTKSRNLLVQMIGRGMRLYSGKANCHIIDMVASLEIGIISTSTLFGLDPAELIEEANVEELQSLKQQRERGAAHNMGANEASIDSSNLLHTITFTDYDSIYDLIDDTSGEKHIRSLSKLSWVHVGENRYILSASSSGYVTIEKTNDSDMEYRVMFTQKIQGKVEKNKSPYMRPRVIAVSDTFSDAVHAADTFASQKMPWSLISHNKPWRKEPASEGQLAFLNKFRDMDAQLTADDVTKGRAMDNITKIKFGAKGRLDKLRLVTKKEFKNNEKVEKIARMRQREQVKVGPTTGF